MEEEIKVTVDQLKILSDPTRLRILSLLFDGEMTITQIASTIGMSPATVHHHITQLLSANLISHTKTEVKGNLVEKYYSMAPGGVDASEIWGNLKDDEKVSYRLSTLGVLKAMVDQAISNLQRKGTVEFEVGLLGFHRLPWREDVIKRVDGILAETRKKLDDLEKEYKEEGEKVTVITTILPG